MIMALKFVISDTTEIPLYRQLTNYLESSIQNGEIKSGDSIPSMNELAAELNISKETVKKAYTYLRDKGVIHSTQGKGYFISAQEEGRKMRILIIFDKLNNSKQTLYNSFSNTIGDKDEIIIQMHNQSVDLLKYFLDENISSYDYFVITPHFPLDKDTQLQVIKQLRRIPNRKLLLLDYNPMGLNGNYGSVYQDFESDAYHGLLQELRKLKKSGKINIITESSSLYHKQVIKAVKTFCDEFDIKMECLDDVNEDNVRKNETYLLVTGQLDLGITKLTKFGNSKNLKPGQDYGIISYNDSPIYDVILNGLTSISTDFMLMGQLGAEMILNKSFKKIKCPFGMTRRATF